MRVRTLAALAALTAALFATAHPAFASATARPAKPAPGDAAKSAPGDAAKPAPGDAAPDGDGIAPYAAFVKDADVQNGLFTVIRKSGKVFLGLDKSQLDAEFYEHATTANGLGGFGILSGDDFEQPARIVTFRRIGEKAVALVLPDSRFDAARGTPIAAAVRASTADSVAAVMAVAAEDKASGKLVVDASYLLGDTLDLGNALSDIVDDPKNPQGGYHEDPARTYFGPSKAFPKNVIIEADQTYASAKPETIDTVADPHSIQMRVKYNFAEILGSPDYRPRLADDRVGYWVQNRIDYSRDDRFDDIERFVTRWNLRASDPSKPSPAVKPLVYTLTDTIPEQYRPAIREAILEWNNAFAKIGILDAIRVQDQPSDPAWDPDDIRYNTIRWLTEANSNGFAEAQIEWDPRTGEIFRGGVLIDSDLMRYANFEFGDLIDPAPATVVRTRHGFLHRDGGAKMQAAFGALALQLMGDTVPASYAHDFLKAVVLHEVGHDFGLAHNFIGHNAFTAAQLKSKAFTERNGVASSVMEYAPVNLWPGHASQGDFYQTVLGPYDYHVIHWGYAPIGDATTPSQEVPTLNRWAAAAVDPRFAFASDEDDEYDGHAIDPRVSTWMLTGDSIAWCGTQLDLDRRLLQTIDARYPRPQQPWDQERAAVALLMHQYDRCAQSMTHYVAGEYLSRARRGDPHAPLPLRPVGRDEEYRAFHTLDTYLFADAAWHVSPQTLSRLTYSEYEPIDNFAYVPTPRHDVSLSGVVLSFQNRALGAMFAPLVLQRLADLPSKATAVAPMTLDDLFSWTQASVYGDLAAGKPGRTLIHRNLQRSYARLLERMAAAPENGTPYDAQALARHELVALSSDVRHSLGGRGLDLQTRAHLEALQAEVRRTLDTRSVQTLHT